MSRFTKFLAILGFITFGGTMGCGTIFGKQVAKSAIDVALAACVAENAWMDEPALQKACSVAEEFLPVVREIVASYKKGLKKQSAMAAKDGG